MTWSAPIERTSSRFLVLAHARHLGAHRLGDLDGERAHASRRAVDEDLLSRLDLSVVPQHLERGGRGHADGRGLLEREVRRLGHELLLGRARVLREGACAPAEHLVTRPKPVTSLPTASTVPAMSVPGTGFFGRRSPVARRMTNGDAGHEDPVTDVDRGRVDPDQHLAVADRRLVDLLRVGGPPPSRTCPGRSPSCPALLGRSRCVRCTRMYMTYANVYLVRCQPRSGRP